jgi:Spy/CpxP family protein refolding chaperone
MRRATAILALLFAVSFISFAQNEPKQPKQYAGQEQREVKALSPEEVQSLLGGQGMGMAKAAELNHYPGPKHVLELAVKLDLSDAQVAETRKIFEKMHAEAVRLGALIVGKERELDALFAKNEINRGKLESVSREIGLLQGSLRAAHLRAHLEMKSLLTPLQVKKYDALRGYDAGGGAHEHHAHGEH